MSATNNLPKLELKDGKILITNESISEVYFIEKDDEGYYIIRSNNGHYDLDTYTNCEDAINEAKSLSKNYIANRI